MNTHNWAGGYVDPTECKRENNSADGIAIGMSNGAYVVVIAGERYEAPTPEGVVQLMRGVADFRLGMEGRT